MHSQIQQQRTPHTTHYTPQGFKALQSNDGQFRRFNIQSARRQDLCYPRAHTCFNKCVAVAHWLVLA